MSFSEVIEKAATYLKADGNLLAAYASEYPFNSPPFGEFPHGGLYPDEGRLLWALIRYQKPAAVLELGTHSGGSATIIASALEVNQRGFLTTVDIDPSAGWLLPDSLRPRVRFLAADIDRWIMEDPVAAYDFCFEDGSHSMHQVHTLYLNRHKFLKRDGIILSHDALVDGAGEFVQYGLRQGGAVGAVLLATSPLGISLYCEGQFDAMVATTEVPVVLPPPEPKEDTKPVVTKPVTQKVAVKRRKKVVRNDG